MKSSEQSVHAYVLLFAGACLFIGILAGILFTRQDSTPGPPPENSPTPPFQHNILIIGTDTRFPLSARLESLWLAVYVPSFNQVYLAPIYPSFKENTPGLGKTLVQTFQLLPSGEPSPEFLTFLKANGISWEAYLLLDETTFAVLIDEYGGLLAGNSFIPGVRAVAGLTPPWEDAHQAFVDQFNLLKTLCAQPNRMVPDLPLEKLLNTRNIILRPSEHQDMDALARLWELFLLQSRMGKITCSFPGQLLMENTPTSSP